MPLAIILLAKVGIISSKFLAKQQRIVIFLTFVVGAIISALLMHFIYIKSIWLITISLITIMVYYSSEVKRLGLKETNL